MPPTPSQFRTFWLWYIGSAVWIFDAALALHYNHKSHAVAAIAVALLFLIAGAVLRSKSNRLR